MRSDIVATSLAAPALPAPPPLPREVALDLALAQAAQFATNVTEQRAALTDDDAELLAAQPLPTRAFAAIRRLLRRA